MFFSRTARPRPKQTFRPSVCCLEDRLVPTGILNFLHHSTPGPATHLQVLVPEQVVSGQSFGVWVTAEDAANHVATGYTGTVKITLQTADASATLPGTYAFQANDHGVHEFFVTLSALGSQTIIATDTTTSTITGSATTTVIAAPPATHLQIIAPHNFTPGIPTPVTVVALDSHNHLVPGFTGTISLTTSDTQATVSPTSHTYVAGEKGAFTFQVTFANSGSQTITATDTADNFTKQVSVNVFTVGPVTHFAVKTLGFALVNFQSPVEVVALDAHNHVVAGYTGTVQLSSSDSNATLPGPYTFLPSDHGSHVFSVTFATTGHQTITATDTTTNTIMGQDDVRVIDRLFKLFAWF